MLRSSACSQENSNPPGHAAEVHSLTSCCPATVQVLYVNLSIDCHWRTWVDIINCWPDRPNTKSCLSHAAGRFCACPPFPSCDSSWHAWISPHPCSPTPLFLHLLSQTTAALLSGHRHRAGNVTLHSPAPRYVCKWRSLSACEWIHIPCARVCQQNLLCSQ